MKKNVFHYEGCWAIVILMFVESSGTDEQESEPGPETSEQIYEFTHLLLNIELQPSTVVFLIRNKNSFDLSINNSDVTEVLKITREKYGHGNTCEIIESYTYPDNFQNPEKLTDTLINIRRQIPVGAKIMLMTWDHGSVYGIFKKNKANIGSSLNEISPSPLARKKFHDFLTAEELSDTIINGFDRKIDLLVMMNCWMQNIHVNAALQNATHCLVASQGLLTPFTYDYNIILSQVENNTGEYIAKKIVKNLVRNYKFKYAPGPVSTPNFMDNRLETRSIFAIKFDENYILFQSAITNFIFKLFNLLTDPNNEELYKAVSDSRDSIFVFDFALSNTYRYYMVDFLAFVQQFSIRSNKLVKEVDELMLLQSRIILESHIGQNPYAVFTRPGAGRRFTEKPTGTGIFFPIDIDDFKDSFFLINLQRKNVIKFYNEDHSKWIPFLKQYFFLASD